MNGAALDFLLSQCNPTGNPVAPSSTPVGRNPEQESPAKAGARVEGSLAPVYGGEIGWAGRIRTFDTGSKVRGLTAWRPPIPEPLHEKSNRRRENSAHSCSGAVSLPLSAMTRWYSVMIFSSIIFLVSLLIG